MACWKVRFGWPTTTRSSTHELPGRGPVVQPISRVHPTTTPFLSVALAGGGRWGRDPCGEPRTKGGGEVEGRAKDGTGGWEADASSGDPVLRLAARPAPLFIPRPSPAYVSATTTTTTTTRDRSSPDRRRSPSGHSSSKPPPDGRMSWQTYVDEHLMCEIEGHHLTSAAIIGHDGTVWAQSAAFPSVSGSAACVLVVFPSTADQIDRSRL